MAKRIFSLSAGMDLSILLSIDTDILTPKWAGEISRFWASKDEVLDASDGDEYQAVARYAAPRLWETLLDGWNADWAVQELHKQEGWCIPTEKLGIEILDHEIPDMSAEYLEVEEMAESEKTVAGHD
ncbi:MAG: hypothetical protein BGP10_12320 [Rhodanobacter sp. 68-29]|nr:DUF2528 family protein [Rhodanobacter sp.]ODV27972.1 MAG: hypothetical protein ABT19_00240 [Rhodanobacter sp. SCN 68-63]OJY60676.1 MAG: hypothetical protein BGP10_12320 [Rhodanobacter sp. 68-29]